MRALEFVLFADARRAEFVVPRLQVLLQHLLLPHRVLKQHLQLLVLLLDRYRLLLLLLLSMLLPLFYVHRLHQVLRLTHFYLLQHIVVVVLNVLHNRKHLLQILLTLHSMF